MSVFRALCKTPFLCYARQKKAQRKYVGPNHQDFGDYLEVNAQTPKDVFDTCFFGYDALLMTKMAGALNRTDDVKFYTELHTNISNAFTKAFVNTTDGKIKGDTQAVYVLALTFELLPQNLRPLAVNQLVDNIKAHGYHYTNGFISNFIFITILSEINSYFNFL